MDIHLFRTPEGLAEVKRSQAARFGASFLPDFIQELDAKVRALKHQVDNEKATLNVLQKEVQSLFQAKEEAQAKAKAAERQALKVKVDKNEAFVKELEQTLASYLGRMGNIVDPSVPVSNDEADNQVLRKHLEPTPAAGKAHHSEVLYRIGGYEAEPGYKIAGNRAYFLTGPGVVLNMALQMYGQQFLADRGFQRVATPLFMDQSVMAKTAQLSQFDEELYKVTGDGEDKYLIATSEQPLTAMHMDEWIDNARLPIRYAGISTCFRKEAGSGKDVKGLFRVHQFEKVEQFCIVKPEDSPAEHERMLEIAEDFYKSLGFAYQVVTIVSGALNDAAAKKWDLEAWFPEQQTYRELVSGSNCTDYQSRKLLVRAGFKEEGQRATFAHMLNCTLVATERTLCCLVENYQEEKGVRVPEVLRPYCGGVEFFPYVRDAPVEKVAAKGAAKKK